MIELDNGVSSAFHTMNKAIAFLDRVEEVLFVDNNQSLEEVLADDFNLLLDKYNAKKDARIFRKPSDELFDYFDEEAYGFSELNLEQVNNDLSLCLFLSRSRLFRDITKSQIN